MNSNTVIRVTDVSKRYTLKHPQNDIDGNLSHEHWALRQVTFDVKQGESVGIVGPNGSGKSTLLKMLSGVAKPTTGEIEISGKVASILDIGAGFHMELSGRENVFLHAQLLGFSKQEISNKYNDIVAFSGIGNFIEEPVKYYSNGMYLRLAFSIIAHLDFDIYLFDEIMSVGDVLFKEKIAHIFDSGKTILLVSHNQSEIDNYTNRVITIKDGRLTQTEQTTYFTDNINYNINQLEFDGGIIHIEQQQHRNHIDFSINTTFYEGHQFQKSWAIHLKDISGNTILACLGHKDSGTSYIDHSNLLQVFKFNKLIFRSGSYSLSLFMTENGNYTQIKPSERYHFLIDNSSFEKDYNCINCGPLYYPNTLTQ